MGWRAPRSQELEDARLADAAEDAANLLAARVTAAEAIVDLAGGGGAAEWPDYAQGDDPGAVGAGKTWLQTPPTIVVEEWEAEETASIEDRIQPTISNGHYYSATSGGTTGVSEPTWPTNGSSVVDGSVTWEDQGLIAGTVVPVGSFQLWRRGDADAGWDPIGISDGAAEPKIIQVFTPNGLLKALISISDTSLVLKFSAGGVDERAVLTLEDDQMSFDYRDATGALVTEVLYNEDGVRINAPVSIDLPTSNPGADLLWNDGGTVKVGT